MRDRATQALLKMAMEPEWEAKFEPNSYGFRPGRSAHDAVEAIHTAICQKAKYVLDADIAKCFDKIDHKKLLSKLNTFPLFERAIKKWLTSGVLDQGELFPTQEGTPQGGVISPLLANIALHGLETELIQAFPTKVKIGDKWHLWKPQVIRYADDFVILHPGKEEIEKCKEIASKWLAEIGLELKPEKTRITHTLIKIDDKTPGFNFLRFNIRSYPVGQTNCGKNNGVKTGFKTLVKPAKENIQAHYQKVAEVITQCRPATQDELISQLISLITGWCNYYATVCSKDIFAQLDHLVWKKLFRGWGKFRHPNKSGRWIAKKYWRLQKGEEWTFGNGSLVLPKHSNTKINRHIKVRGGSSPYDGNWTYWSKRKGEYPGLSKKVTITIKKQKGKCAECGLSFLPDNLVEIHHKDGNYRDNRLENLTAVHLHCHDRIHGGIGNLTAQLSIHDKDQLGEEPDDRKLSRPVLKPSRVGDHPA